ncbi:hypothetical protein [Photobacterium minamisatsumaniensis]|uniref:hypothetical protein n=1 Tax=Photobacterium minamisatsumaniensis TaxID=2910233 RepID=UPI003D11F5BE
MLKIIHEADKIIGGGGKADWVAHCRGKKNNPNNNWYYFTANGPSSKREPSDKKGNKACRTSNERALQKEFTHWAPHYTSS